MKNKKTVSETGKQISELSMKVWKLACRKTGEGNHQQNLKMHAIMCLMDGVMQLASDIAFPEASSSDATVAEVLKREGITLNAKAQN